MGVTAGVLLTFKQGSREQEQLPGLNILGPLCSDGRARSYAPQGRGRSNQRFSSRERKKKKTLNIQQPGTEGLKTQTMENLCVAFSRKMMDVIAGGCLLELMQQHLRQIKNWTSRGFQKIQGAESILDLTRHQTPRCLQDNWKNNRGEVDCAMICASGNKEIHSAQRTVHEIRPTRTCTQTTVRIKLNLGSEIFGANKPDAHERHKKRKKKIPKHRWMKLGRGRTKTGSKSDARPLMTD